MPAEKGCAAIPQAAHTLGYYWVEYRKDETGLSNADGFVNECGVVITSNSMGTSRESADNAACVKDGGIAYNLRRALAERAQTARDGARILMELVDDGAMRRPAAPTPSPIRAKPSCSSWRAAATTWARACRMTRLPSCPITSTCTG